MDSGLWFQILGPVRAWRGGAEVGLGGPKQRAVLAVLLVNAGEPVSCSMVIDVLWPQGPPPSAVNIVQTFVKRLRQVVEPQREHGAPSRLLRRVPGGYLIEATEWELDLVRFRRLLDQASRARGRNEMDLAGVLLGAAVRPWRGPPMADLDLWVRSHPAVAALEQERLNATLDYADIELAAGRGARIVPWLEQVVGSAPLHEPLHARLMASYGQARRPADALRSYERIRTELREKLGMDPSGELQAMHNNILRGDPAAAPVNADTPGAATTQRSSPQVGRS